MKKESNNTTERWQLLKRHFVETRTLGAQERERYFAEHCSDDVTLRAEVETLLDGNGDLAPLRSSIDKTAADLFTNDTTTGERIGAYQIVRELGQGGMGTVWLASRSDKEFDSNVAIKVMHGLSGEHLRQRFLAERQMLANLNHPNISKLLDGGTTSSGTPYVVMEHVEGLPIDAYCDKHRLTQTERIQLFCTVCDAIQYAHRNLIVHRDIKPENILVTEDRAPKLLDFGIAKLLDETAPHNPSQTVLGQSMLTPRYASPEQVLNEPIATTSDIYSSGVLLYKLLTGSLPYDFESDDLLKMAEAVCETEPVKPSSHNPSLKGDLDNILLKALRKKPENRYASVNDFSNDLKRHMTSLPIQARPSTALYRLNKFVSRNPVTVALSTMLVVGLMGATAFSVHQMQQAIDAQSIAERERSIAVSETLRTTLRSAKEALDAKDPRSARRLLERVNSRDRGWTWSALSQQTDQSLATTSLPDAVATVSWDTAGLITLSAEGNILWQREATVIENVRLSGGRIAKARFSQDGKLLLAAHESGELQLWNVATPGQAAERFNDNAQDRVVDLALSADGTHLAWITRDTMSLWNTSTSISHSVALENEPKRLAISANGSRVGVTFQSGEANGFALFTSTGKRITSNSRYEVFGLAFSPDGKQFATSEAENTIRLRETATNRVLRRFLGHREPAHEIVFSGGGQWLISGSQDGTLRHFDVDGSEPTKTLMGIESKLEAIQVDRTGRETVARFADGNIKRFDSTDPASLPNPIGKWVVAHPNSEELYSITEFGLLRRYDLGTHQMFDQTTIGRLASTSIALSTDASTLAIGEYGRIILIDTATLSVKKTVDTPGHDVAALHFSPTQPQLASMQSDGTLLVFDLKTDDSWTLSKGHSSDVGTVDFSPAHAELASAQGHSVTLWNSATRKQLQTFKERESQVLAVAYSHSGALLATGWSDGAVRLLDARTLEFKAELSERTGAVRAIAFSPDDRLIATGSEGAEVWIWNVTTRRPILNLNESGTARVENLQFSPDGNHLVSSFSSEEVRIWSTHSSNSRWRALSAFTSVKDQQRVPVETLFEKNRNPSDAALHIRKNASLSVEQRRAALQLVLRPPALDTVLQGDPFDGYSMSFQGADDHVLAANPQKLAMQARFTLEAWVRPEAFANSTTPLALRMLINKEGEYQIAIRPDGSVYWTLASDQGWMGWVPALYRLERNQWTHLALVRDVDVVRLYLNGQLVQEHSVPVSIGDQHLDKNEFRIGGRQHTPSSFYGQMDEVRVWGTARSQQEIQQAMRRNVTGQDLGLIAAWSFDEGQGTNTAELRDAHAGSISGARWVETKAID